MATPAPSTLKRTKSDGNGDGDPGIPRSLRAKLHGDEDERVCDRVVRFRHSRRFDKVEKNESGSNKTQTVESCVGRMQFLELLDFITTDHPYGSATRIRILVKRYQ